MNTRLFYLNQGNVVVENLYRVRVSILVGFGP